MRKFFVLSTSGRQWLKALSWGALAGGLAGVAMLLTMGLLRLVYGVPTPTEMIFDRLFPKITIQFFIDSLVRAGGYTPLKLQGVFGALAGQLGVAVFGGIVYAAFLRWRGLPADPAPGSVTDRRGWRLILPGLAVAWVLFVILLWPQLLTSYHGLPPGPAVAVTSAAMLLDFAVCGVGILFFHGLLTRSSSSRVDKEGAAAPAPLTTGGGASIPDGTRTTRRVFLAGALGFILTTALGATLRQLFKIGTFSYDGREYLGPGVQKITPIAPEDEFYQVSKNLVDPKVNLPNWQFDIVGQVENPRVYSYAEILTLPAVEQETTLLCISYRVGGGLCSNAVWKGVPLHRLIDAARPKGDVSALLFHAADGYYETVPFAKVMEPTTLLAYGMNGEVLPDRHGYPLRMIVPGLYGEKQPKWITRIELLDRTDHRLHGRHGYGFYKEQGWGPNFTIPTTSRIDAPQVTGDHFEDEWTVGEPVELRGMAFGGDRGITKVEVSTDGGDSWEPAQITKPGTKLCWSLWSFTWKPDDEDDNVQVIVRATDGEGKLQIAESRNTVPEGATGLHHVRARVEKA